MNAKKSMAQMMMMTSPIGGFSVADVFSIDLWTGNGSIRDITTGRDYVANDVLVWIKNRSNAGFDHILNDTQRGPNKELRSSATDEEGSSTNRLKTFKSNGYELGTDNTVNAAAGHTFVGWSFLKSARFFNVITYSGDSVGGREIAHGLDVAPGMVVVKRLNGISSWSVQHISRGGTVELILNTNAAENIFASGIWENTSADATNVTLGAASGVNAAGATYVMYVFAHDVADDGIIHCGEYTGNGSTTGPSIALGWTPQYIMIKRAVGGTGDWIIIDTTRGISAGNDPSLDANTTTSEVTTIDYADLTATGFDIATADTDVNASGSTYIFMAIREE